MSDTHVPAGEPTSAPLFYRLSLLLSLLLLCATAISAFSCSICGDEAFSLNLIRHSYADVVRITAADVHPPLYYFLLKVGVDLSQWVSGSSMVIIPATKLVSLLPYGILLWICATHVRRRFGDMVSAFAMPLLFCAPAFFTMATEIRMYSWAMLFVTLAYLAVCELVLHPTRRRAWVLLTLSTLAAAYTQYYAGFAAGLLYAMPFFRAFRHSVLRRPLLLSLSCVALLYTPWLFIFIRQVTQGDFSWVPLVTIMTPVSTLLYALGTINAELTLLYTLLIACTVVYLARNASVQLRWITFPGILLPLVFGLISCLLARLLHVHFFERYIFPGLFCFWLGLLSLLFYRPNKIGSVILISAFLLIHLFLFFMVRLPKEYQAHLSTERFCTFAAEHPTIGFLSRNPHQSETAVTLSPHVVGLSWQHDSPWVYRQVFDALPIRNLTQAEELVRVEEQEGALYFCAYDDPNTPEGELPPEATEFVQSGAAKLQYAFDACISGAVKIYRVIPSETHEAGK